MDLKQEERSRTLSKSESPEPLVTVGLPVYNGERHLTEAIESLLNQTFEDFLILISDNASTDGTGAICKRFARVDSRIRYHRKDTNIGLPDNFNLLFGMARSKYFRWATDDDYISVEMLADAVQVLEADPALALCYPRAHFVDADGNVTGPWEDELHLLQDDPVNRFRSVVSKIRRVHHPLGLMRSEIVRRTGLLGRHVGSDQGFIAELSLHGKFFQIPKYQFFRRIHEGSSSWATADEAHQARLYHPAHVRRTPLNFLRWHWRLIAAVHRSPLGIRDRARAYRFLAKVGWWNRVDLMKESFREARLVARNRP